MRKKRSLTPYLVICAVVIVVSAVAAFELLRPASSAGKAVGPQETTAAVPISVTGFVQAPYPPSTLEFNSTLAGSYTAQVITETGCTNAAGGVCFIYSTELPPDNTYMVYAILEGPGGVPQVCDAGTLDVTVVGNYNVDVSC